MTQNSEVSQDYNPMQQFQKWFCEAGDVFDEQEPNAMSITTIDEDGFLKSRMVLLKKYTWEGFIFFTNYNSEKAKAIQVNPKVNLVFNWLKSGRRIEIKGEATKITEEASRNYFHQRPRGSQLGAWASHQSDVVASRDVLEAELARLEQEFKGEEIPKPEFWGGFLIRPQTFCFLETGDKINNKTVQSEERFRLQKDFSWTKTKQLFVKPE